MPKTVDTRKHCKVGLRACNNLPQPPPYIFVFRGCGRLLHVLNPTLQCFLVSTVFGIVSSLHLTSDFYTCYTCIRHDRKCADNEIQQCCIDLMTIMNIMHKELFECIQMVGRLMHIFSCGPQHVDQLLVVSLTEGNFSD